MNRRNNRFVRWYQPNRPQPNGNPDYLREWNKVFFSEVISWQQFRIMEVPEIVGKEYVMLDVFRMPFKLPAELLIRNRPIVICIGFSSCPKSSFLYKNWPTTIVPARALLDVSQYHYMKRAITKASRVMMQMSNDQDILHYLQDQMNFAFNMSKTKTDPVTKLLLCLPIHPGNLDHGLFDDFIKRRFRVDYLNSVFGATMSGRMNGKLFHVPSVQDQAGPMVPVESIIVSENGQYTVSNQFLKRQVPLCYKCYNPLNKRGLHLSFDGEIIDAQNNHCIFN